VLALAAQSIQELLKATLALKGYARVQALRGLLMESARTVCQSKKVGLGILESVQERLRRLGQAGSSTRSPDRRSTGSTSP
jgi:HEPN domain-containing protein